MLPDANLRAQLTHGLAFPTKLLENSHLESIREDPSVTHVVLVIEEQGLLLSGNPTFKYRRKQNLGRSSWWRRR